jgi:hypothetical protein
MNLVITLIKICTLQSKPEDIQYNPSAALFVSLLVIAINIVIFTNIETLSSPVAYAISIYLAQILALFGLLRILGKDSRFTQTVTGLFGTSAVLTIVSILFNISQLLAFFVGFLFLWQFYIPTVILRSSMEVPGLIAFLSYLGIAFFSFTLTALIFSDFVPELSLWLEQMSQQAQALNS